MIDPVAQLSRIADALERLVPPPAPEADPAAHDMLRWTGTRLEAASPGSPLPLDRFAGVDSQMQALQQNFTAHAAGFEAHDCLLWGARGSGKSALVRAVGQAAGLCLVEADAEQLGSLPLLFSRLRTRTRRFLVFVDDLAFESADPAVRALRSLLDGGVTARPANARIVVTSNHRHIVSRGLTASTDLPTTARHARDMLDDQLALVDRFGLVLGFHMPSQDVFLDMVRRHCAADGLQVDETEALAFALARGGRSGRTAWHYRTDLLARRANQG